MYTFRNKKTTSNEVNQNSTIKVKRKIKKSYDRHPNRTKIICTYVTHELKCHLNHETETINRPGISICHAHIVSVEPSSFLVFNIDLFVP